MYEAVFDKGECDSGNNNAKYKEPTRTSIFEEILCI